MMMRVLYRVVLCCAVLCCGFDADGRVQGVLLLIGGTVLVTVVASRLHFGRRCFTAVNKFYNLQRTIFML